VASVLYSITFASRSEKDLWCDCQ